MNELVVKVEQKVGLLNWNFEELNVAMDQYLERYKNLVVSEEQVKDAKAIRAELNRVKTNLEDRRKQAKAEFCKPYEDFAEQEKIVVAKIDNVIGGIDGQIKDFETREKQEKYDVMKTFWETECVTSPAIPFEKVFDKKMLAKSVRESAWKKQLTARKQTIANELNAIAGFESEKRDFVLNEYLKTLDAGTAIMSWESYREQLRQAEEYRRQAEEKAQAMIRKMEEAQQEPQKPVEMPRKEESRQIVQPQQKQPENTVYHRCMDVWGTKEQIIALGNYMNANGIRFHKREEK